jgi:hypothetical protein
MVKTAWTQGKALLTEEGKAVGRGLIRVTQQQDGFE